MIGVIGAGYVGMSGCTSGTDVADTLDRYSGGKNK